MYAPQPLIIRMGNNIKQQWMVYGNKPVNGIVYNFPFWGLHAVNMLMYKHVTVKIYKCANEYADLQADMVNIVKMIVFAG